MSIRRLTFATMFSLLSMFTLGLVWAGVVGAYATPEGPPVYSTAPGLPDGRVYELASPPDKNGNEAGSSSLNLTGEVPGNARYGVASAEGDSVLFEVNGPMGETPAATEWYYVATRTSSGWHTRSVAPRPQESAAEKGIISTGPGLLDPSPDLSHAMVQANSVRLSPQAPCSAQMYLTGSDPFVAGTWLEQPETADPIAICGRQGTANGVPVGGTPDFSTVYFTYPGTLLPEDAPRAVHVQSREGGADVEAWGFYEYSEGVLHEAGVLPDDSLSPFGAVPATSGHGIALSGNEVSKDGSRAFFVSPDPKSCEQNDGMNDCAIDPPELYVREDGSETRLVSRDTLLPEVSGLPVGAPDGVSRMVNLIPTQSGILTEMYVFASPDGSHAFFQSEDQLTSNAPEGPPGNTSTKTYEFDVDTGVLTYLPDVAGQIVGTSEDGSSMAFVRPTAGSLPAELDLWSTGPGGAGGSVTPITPLPGGADVEPVRMSSDGSVVVFTATEVPGFNEGTSSEIKGNISPSKQIFRYDAHANTLGCVSCGPAGVNSVNSSLSIWRYSQLEASAKLGNAGQVDERGMSSDGDRVFFQTATPLVPQDTNIDTTRQALEAEGVEPQGVDVYEWENGVVYLISTGKNFAQLLLLG